MLDLRTNYLGFELKNPIIVGSSGLTNTVENIVEIEKQGGSAVVLKSLFEEQINHDINRTISAGEPLYSYPEAEDYIKNYARSHSLDGYLRLISESKKKVNIPVIASINCVSSSEWISFASRIEQAGADALELNIFILPSDMKRTPEQNEQVYFDIIMAIMKEVSIPVAVKISYYFSGLSKTALRMSWTGIKGMVLFNRFFSPDIDINTFQITPSHVFSSPNEISQTLRWVAILSNRIHCDIAASTGIHDGEAAVKVLLAGAKAVQVTSVLYKNGLSYIQEMINFIELWMSRNNFTTTKDFIGKLSYKETVNPAAYERVQFMKHFSNIE